MKKWLLGLFLVYSSAAWAQVSYMDEVKSLGIIAGQGLACQAAQYKTFELLARAIILTKAPSVYSQEEGLKAYMEKKANVFINKQLDGFADCPEIAARFDNQDIFKATLYADGTIKMPDGQVITPIQPYDATAIYDANEDDLKHANDIYNRNSNKVNKKIEFKDNSAEQGY